jgi:hypothetical protein
MPEDARGRYLAELEAVLPMPDGRRSETIEEIAAHLDDAVADRVEGGADPDQAEADAQARLGSPTELARSLARTGQSDAALSELETLVAAGFANLAVIANTDLDSLRTSPRFQAFEKRANANAKPCEADPKFRQFDFWVGEWDVQPTGPNRTPLGTGATSVIEKQLEGCVIQENWLPAGGTTGKSFNTYNRITSQWEQYYVDQSGRITHYKGAFKDDGNLYFEADQFGGKSKVRMTFFNQGPNQVRQLGHISNDGGKTWTVSFDLTYVRKKQ